MTNYLKEIISYRQWNMMEETFLVNDVKETTCFVSDHPDRDLDICRSAPPQFPCCVISLTASVSL